MSSRARRIQSAAYTLIPLAALLFLFFGSALIRGESFVFRDAAHFYYPLFAYVQSVWGEGRFPLWNPYDGVGMPLLAEPSASVFYPGKLIFALPISFPAALRWYVVLHFALAYLATYNAARRLGVSRSAAILAAVSYSFGGYVVATHANVIFLVGAAWAPLALLAGIRLAADQVKPSAAPLLAFSLAMMILGGDPQAAFHLALVAGVYFLGRHVRLLRTPLLFARRAAPLAAAIGLAAGLSAVQILPTVEWAARSRRALVDQPRTVYSYAQQKLTRDDVSAAVLLGKVEQGTQERESYQFSLGPWRWPELIWANFTGKMYPENHRWADAIPAEGRVWAPSLYVGVTSLALALIGACSCWRQPLGKLLIGMTAIGVLGSLGWYGLGWLLIELRHDLGLNNDAPLPFGEPLGGVYWLLNILVPGYASFRYPAKLWLLAALAGSLLVGFGFDAELKRQFRWLTRAMLALAAMSGAAALAVTLARDSILAGLPQIPPNLLFGPLDAAAGLAEMQTGMLQAVIVACCVAILLCIPYNRATLLAPLLIAIVAIDLYVGLGWTVATMPDYAWSQNRYGENYQESARWYRNLTANDYPPEFAEQGSPQRQFEGLYFDRMTLFPRYHLLERVGSIAPSNSLAPADYSVLLAEMKSQLKPDQFAPQLSAAGLIDFDRSTPEGQVLIDDSLEGVTPMTWVAADWRHFPIADQRSRSSWREAADVVLRRQPRQAILHGEEESSLPMAKVEEELVAEADYRRIADDVIEANVSLSRPAYLIVQEYYDPGWIAEIDNVGSSKTMRPTERANLIFQAIPLPAGQHRVTLRYRPASFTRGLTLTLISLTALIAWGATATQLRRREPA
ncbi:YfhO family protein [Blastopirellula marina]|uniref:YfhO family protein n=1 Tax=Blastopirellula marina TaxID=124 RepID=A0A2S8GEV1_9BACT|nr:YfhO family protein [Blastopirellula marina]PQO42943.1 hypothetical protein C5Y93_24790 [Blastopirellula marina]